MLEGIASYIEVFYFVMASLNSQENSKYIINVLWNKSINMIKNVVDLFNVTLIFLLYINNFKELIGSVTLEMDLWSSKLN